MMGQLSSEQRIIRLEETESTNSYLKQLLKERRLEDGTIVLSDYQSRGRGQVGNTWVSNQGENLLFSLVIYPPSLKAGEQFIISRVVALAVKNTLSHYVDGVAIKWPNDIYVQEQKIAGILIENDIRGVYVDNTVIGIGLNVNQTEFPEGLPNPVSLRQITGMVYDRDDLLDRFRREFSLLYADWRNGAVKRIEDAYMLHLYRRDGYHWYEDRNGQFMAAIEEVLPTGHLVLKIKDSKAVRHYAFKEVVFVNPSNPPFPQSGHP